jgi:hypothetical protein
MAYNGSGVFVRIYNWVTDKANNVKITASRMDAEMDGFATGLSTAVTKDGQTTITANLPMAGFKHTGVGAGTARTHYADVGSEQDGTYHWCGTAGGTANAITLTPSPAITAYVAGQRFNFTAGASPNSAATTIAVSGLTTKAAQINGSALAGGEIAAGKTYEALYDGTQFQIFGSVSFPSNVTVGGNETIKGGNLTLGVAGTVTGSLTLAGATSGTLTLTCPAVAGSNSVTFPAGTTDFSATGGTSRVLKQTSAGGALTVAQLAASDLSNGTTGSGAVALAAGPTFTGTLGAETILATGQVTGKDLTSNGSIAAPAAKQCRFTHDGTNTGRVIVDGADAATVGAYAVLLQKSDGTATITGFGLSGAGAATFPSISTTASAANAFVDNAASNSLLRSTSALKYKADPQPLTLEDALPILGLTPASFLSLAEADDPEKRFIGMIADEAAGLWAFPGKEIASGTERLATYVNGEVDGFSYDRLPVLMLVIMQEQQRRLAALESALAGEAPAP